MLFRSKFIFDICHATLQHQIMHTYIMEHHIMQHCIMEHQIMHTYIMGRHIMQHCIMEHQIMQTCIMGRHIMQHCILKRHIMQACVAQKCAHQTFGALDIKMVDGPIDRTTSLLCQSLQSVIRQLENCNGDSNSIDTIMYRVD